MRVFKQLALLGMVLALLVMSLGAYVRLNDAGLGCPDWPGCYGELSVPQSQLAITKVQAIYPDKPLEAGKAWLEMTHRYAAGSLGLLVLAISIMAWQQRRVLRTAWWSGSALLLLIIFQAMLGMWTVTLLLKPVVVSLHLLGGMCTLAVLTWLYVRHSALGFPLTISVSPVVRSMSKLGLLVLLIQIFLGGWTSSNYAGLACTDFPTCHGAWWPAMNFGDAFYWLRALGKNATGHPLTLESVTAIQWTHRLWAGVTLLYLGGLSWVLIQQAQWRGWGSTLLVLLLGQIALGIANVMLHLPLVLAVSHHFVAALLLVTLVSLNALMTAERVK